MKVGLKKKETSRITLVFLSWQTGNIYKLENKEGEARLGEKG